MRRAIACAECLGVSHAFDVGVPSSPQPTDYIVERMGRHLRVCGPGKHYLMPFIDRAIVIDLEAELPGWQGMTEGEIVAKITRQRHGVEMT